MKRQRIEAARRKAREYVLRKEGSAIMRKAGTHPSFIYAWEKTGMLVGEDTPHTEEQRQEWTDAVEEWHEQNPEQSLELEDDDATATTD